jgi:hypothetical protein
MWEDSPFIKLMSLGERREEASPWASTARGQNFAGSNYSKTIIPVLPSSPKQSLAKWAGEFGRGPLRFA